MADPTVLFADHGTTALITLNRPAALNSLTRQMHMDLWAALDQAEANPAIRALVITGAGRGFCAGADLNASDLGPGTNAANRPDPGVTIDQTFNPTTRRLQNLRMPSIAAVNGVAAGAGVSLALACDIIIAAEDAQFLDNTVNMGLPGAEFFNHPWELGVRKAKELLFTSGWWDAAEAHRLGMVNHVVPRDQLEEFTLTMAKRIATQPLFALKTVKEAVNVAQDSQGRVTAMQTSFALHQLGHAHNMQVFGLLIDPSSTAAALSKSASYTKKTD